MSKPAPGAAGREISLLHMALQIVLTVGIFYFWSTPLIQPIKLMVVLLHEMSHGLMALASGGTVHDIVITPDEGGACRSEGGNALLIAGAGYLGSMFFGGMILRAARGGSSVPVAYAILTLLVLGAAVTVLRDSYSRTFALALGGFFIFIGLIAPSFIGAFGLRLLGTGNCLYAIFDIYSDLVIGDTGAITNASSKMQNDAQAFSSLTGVPPQTVGLAWFIVSVLFFMAILKASIESTPTAKAPATPASVPAGSAS